MKPESRVTLSRIFLFWIPLQVTWLLMATEGPFVAAMIARMPEATYNLAAFGVAMPLALLVEAPVIMLLSASAALVRDKESFLKLRRFTLFLNILVTLLILLCLVPSVFHFLAFQILSLPAEVEKLTYLSLMSFLPWPAAIGYRRFYQGLLIVDGKTRLVALCTGIRLVVMGLIALLLASLSVKGAILGGAALSGGVVAEALVTRFVAKDSRKKILEKDHDAGEPLTLRRIWTFYYPLFMGSLLAMVVMPLITLFIARSRSALESLAVLPVLNGFVFIFRTFGLSYQEVVISLVGAKRENEAMLRRFALLLGLGTTFLYGAIVFTPALSTVLEGFFGLPEGLFVFAVLPLKLLILFPALTVQMNWQRSLLMSFKTTMPITVAALLELGLICLTMVVAVLYFDLIGVVAASIALMVGRVGTNFYFHSVLNPVQNTQIKTTS